MKTFNRLLMLCVMALCLNACRKETPPDAPSPGPGAGESIIETPVIYSLLDRADRTHWVVINKGYLVNSNTIYFGQGTDSTTYAPGDVQNAVVEELDGNTVVNAYPLQDTLINGVLQGVYHRPVTTAYFFTTNTDLAQDRSYRFRAMINGIEVSAVTEIVNNFAFNAVDANPMQSINMVTPGGGGYTDWELNWTSGQDGRRYQATCVMRYVEVRNVTDSTHRSVVFPLGSVVTTGLGGEEQQSAVLSGQGFYETLGNTIPIDPTVQRRVFTGIDLVIDACSDLFHAYQPSADIAAGITEDLAAPNNITNGHGVFTSRGSRSVIGKRLNDASLNELINGPYTVDLLFCSGFNVGPPFGCD